MTEGLRLEFATGRKDGIDHIVERAQHIGCAYSQQSDSVFSQPKRTCLVKVWPVTHVMHDPVDFDAQFGLRAIEVQNELAYRMLAAELDPLRILTKIPPK